MIGVIVQARMQSTRLPGKLLLKVCNRTLLEHMITRVQCSKTIDKIIIATTTSVQDNKIEKICKKMKIDCFRGSENDVLERYYAAAKEFNVNTIVRLTSDTPLIDPLIIDKIINYYKNNNFDYVSNTNPLPRTFPDGYNVEVFSYDILKRAHLEAKRPSDREHVTNYISMQPHIFSIGKVNHTKDISRFRLNLDYYEDFLLIKEVFNNLYDEEKIFYLNDIIKFLNIHPEVYQLNSQIKPYENIMKSFERDAELGFEDRKENFYVNHDLS